MRKKRIISYRAEHFDAGEWRQLTGETTLIDARAAIRQAGAGRDTGLRIVRLTRSYKVGPAGPTLASESSEIDFEI